MRNVSDHLGFYNKRPQTGRFKQRNSTSYQDAGQPDPGASSLPGLQKAVLLCPYMEVGGGREGKEKGERGRERSFWLIGTLTSLGGPYLMISCKPKSSLLVSSSQVLKR